MTYLHLIRAALLVGALASIGYGLALIHPPAAYVVVGGLVWWRLK